MLGNRSKPLPANWDKIQRQPSFRLHSAFEVPFSRSPEFADGGIFPVGVQPSRASFSVRHPSSINRRLSVRPAQALVAINIPEALPRFIKRRSFACYVAGRPLFPRRQRLLSNNFPLLPASCHHMSRLAAIRIGFCASTAAIRPPAATPKPGTKPPGAVATRS